MIKSRQYTAAWALQPDTVPRHIIECAILDVAREIIMTVDMDSQDDMARLTRVLRTVTVAVTDSYLLCGDVSSRLVYGNLDAAATASIIGLLNIDDAAIADGLTHGLQIDNLRRQNYTWYRRFSVDNIVVQTSVNDNAMSIDIETIMPRNKYRLYLKPVINKDELRETIAQYLIPRYMENAMSYYWRIDALCSAWQRDRSTTNSGFYVRKEP